MSLLFDTHAFLWFVHDDPQLSARARRAIDDAENVLVVSIASLWEISIKVNIGMLEMRPSFEEFVRVQLRTGFRLLPIEFRHTATYVQLPLHHRDLFDRMLIAQAIADDLTIVTGDAAFRKYRVKRIW